MLGVAALVISHVARWRKLIEAATSSWHSSLEEHNNWGNGELEVQLRLRMFPRSERKI